MSDLRARMAPRVTNTPAKPVADVFRSPSDEMQRVTVYLPRSTVRALKQAGLDRDTSMSKILTELAEQWLRRHDVKT
jgi:hypothetical protein